MIDGLQRAGFRGVNVTVPHKEAAFALAHHCDAAAKAAGAANLLVFHADGRIEGRNTDAVGLTRILRESIGHDLQRPAPWCCWARAARRAARSWRWNALGAAKVHILNRHPTRRRCLARALQPMVASAIDAWRA